MPTDLRAHRVRVRRAQILDAATRVFAEKGFHRTTVRDIARAAGLADGTLYNYFENKDAVLLGVLGRLNETEERAAAFETGMASPDARAFFEAYLRHRLSVIRPGADVFRAALPEMLARPALRARYLAEYIAPTMAAAEQLLQALVDAGRLRAVDVPLTVRALTGVVTGLFLLYLLGDETVDARWEGLPGALTTLLFDGLAAAP